MISLFLVKMLVSQSFAQTLVNCFGKQKSRSSFSCQIATRQHVSDSADLLSSFHCSLFLRPNAFVFVPGSAETYVYVCVLAFAEFNNGCISTAFLTSLHVAMLPVYLSIMNPVFVSGYLGLGPDTPRISFLVLLWFYLPCLFVFESLKFARQTSMRLFLLLGVLPPATVCSRYMVVPTVWQAMIPYFDRACPAIQALLKDGKAEILCFSLGLSFATVVRARAFRRRGAFESSRPTRIACACAQHGGGVVAKILFVDF